MNLQKTLLTAFVILQIALRTSLTCAQERIDNLTYARTAIKVPEGCLTESEYHISGCNGFSAQWLYLSEVLPWYQKCLLPVSGEPDETSL